MYVFYTNIILVSLKLIRVKVLYAIYKILSKEFIDVVSRMVLVTCKENYKMLSIYIYIYV